MEKKVSFDELVEAYGLDTNGNLVNGIDPIVFVDQDNTIVSVGFFTLEDQYTHTLETQGGELVWTLDDCDYWSGLSGDVDINIYCEDGGPVLISFYPVVNGETDTNFTRLEGISCFLSNVH